VVVKWREEWRRYGGACLGFGGVLFIAGETSSRAGFTIRHGRIVPFTSEGNPLLVGIGIGVVLFGLWAFLSTFPRFSWLPFPGKSRAGKTDCDLFAQTPEVLLNQPGWQEANGTVTFSGKITLIKLTLCNKGDTAWFAAQLFNLRNVTRSDGFPMETYRTMYGWEDVADIRQLIGTDFRMSLGPLWLWDAQGIGVFNIPHSAVWTATGYDARRPMLGWKFKVIDRNNPIEFDVMVVNENKATTATWHVSFYWQDNGNVTAPVMEQIK
jgi:hypothetical protein